MFNAIATTFVFRDTVHHFYISTSFVETLLLPLFLTFYRVQAACEMNTRTNMTVSDEIEAHECSFDNLNICFITIILSIAYTHFNI